MLAGGCLALTFVFAGLPARAQAPAAPAAPDRSAPAPDASAALLHTPIAEGRRGSAISVTAVVQSALVFEKLVLAYRKAEGDEFLGRPMNLVGSDTYSAEIPASATAGSQVAYFIEALDKDGEVVAGRGSPERPLVIALLGEAPAGGRRGEGDGDMPLRRVTVALSIGSGVGLASGYGDLNADVPVHGRLAPAGLFHLSPEVGLWFSRSLLLSLQGRLQFVTGTTDLLIGDRRYHAARGAVAVFARAAWLFRPHQDFQPLFSLSLGVGEIRHVLDFDYHDCGDDHHQRCVDSVAAGPLLAGGGTGFFYALGETVALVAQLNAQLGAPRATLNFDANLGLAMRF